VIPLVVPEIYLEAEAKKEPTRAAAAGPVVYPPIDPTQGRQSPFFFVPPCITLKRCGALCCRVHGHIEGVRA
jgi:hypothetical protein